MPEAGLGFSALTPQSEDRQTSRERIENGAIEEYSGFVTVEVETRPGYIGEVRV
jgi:hypothetical protein